MQIQSSTWDYDLWFVKDNDLVRSRGCWTVTMKLMIKKFTCFREEKLILMKDTVCQHLAELLTQPEYCQL